VPRSEVLIGLGATVVFFGPPVAVALGIRPIRILTILERNEAILERRNTIASAAGTTLMRTLRNVVIRSAAAEYALIALALAVALVSVIRSVGAV